MRRLVLLGLMVIPIFGIGTHTSLYAIENSFAIGAYSGAEVVTSPGDVWTIRRHRIPVMGWLIFGFVVGFGLIIAEAAGAISTGGILGVVALIVPVDLMLLVIGVTIMIWALNPQLLAWTYLVLGVIVIVVYIWWFSQNIRSIS